MQERKARQDRGVERERNGMALHFQLPTLIDEATTYAVIRERSDGREGGRWRQKEERERENKDIRKTLSEGVAPGRERRDRDR